MMVLSWLRSLVALARWADLAPTAGGTCGGRGRALLAGVYGREPRQRGQRREGAVRLYGSGRLLRLERAQCGRVAHQCVHPRLLSDLGDWCENRPRAIMRQASSAA